MSAQTILACAGQGLRVVVFLAAAFAVGAIRPGGMTLAMDNSDAQKKVFNPEKAYTGVPLKGSEVQEDNDWNSGKPSQEKTPPRKKIVFPERTWTGSGVRMDNDWNAGTPSQQMPLRKLPAGGKDRTRGRAD